MAGTHDAGIGKAWRSHVSNNNLEAINTLEDILAGDLSDSDMVDALYGLGLAKRANGDTAGAKAALEKALEKTKEFYAALTDGSGENNLDTDEDDRFLMLTRMIQQRLDEIN